MDIVYLVSASNLLIKEKKRSYMSNEDKFKVSAAIPDWFNEVICGVMLSNGTIRTHGKYALLNIQQTHEELTQNLW